MQVTTSKCTTVVEGRLDLKPVCCVSLIQLLTFSEPFSLSVKWERYILLYMVAQFQMSKFECKNLNNVKHLWWCLTHYKCLINVSCY